MREYMHVHVHIVQYQLWYMYTLPLLLVCVTCGLLGTGFLQVCQSDSQYVAKEHIIQGPSGKGTL